MVEYIPSVGGGDTQISFIGLKTLKVCFPYREAPLRGLIPYLFIYCTIYDRRGTPFVYLLSDKWNSFDKPSLQLLRPFLTAANALSLKYEQITKPERILDFFTAFKCICEPFWAFSLSEMTDFPVLSNTSTSEIPTLSYF